MLSDQIAAVGSFATNDALKLNPSKCEAVVIASKRTESTPVGTVCHQQLYPSNSAKCLGFWWSWDLSADKPIEHAIASARRAFFAFGAKKVFQGEVNPLTGRALYETFDAYSAIW